MPSEDKKVPEKHPGMLGDGTEEQNLNQEGDPDARIDREEVEEAFGDKSKTREPSKK